MRKRIVVLWGAALLLIALAAGAAGAAYCRYFGGAWCATLQEQLTGETPEARIAAYLEAAAQGDENGALAVWELPDWRPGEWSALEARRREVTHDLVAAGTRAQFDVLSIEWWGTCCERHVTGNARAAGEARVRVALRDSSGVTRVYVFDVWVRGNTYWGAALRYPPRHWVLRDVYLEGEAPLFGPVRS